MKLPDGINSEVGAIGSKISGGQKQRLAIARALVRNPDMLIFDEATSALDSKSENEVQKAIDEIAKTTQITKVVIAHRLSTIRDADKIVVMESGKIIEEGTHEQLKQQSTGLYAQLCRTQEQADALLKQVKNKKHVHYGNTEQLLSKNKDDEEEQQVSKFVDQADTDSDEELSEQGDRVGSTSKDSTANDSLQKPREKMTMTEIFYALIPYNTPSHYPYIVLIGATIVGSLIPCLAYPNVKLLIDFTGVDRHYMKHRMTTFIPIIAAFGLAAMICQTITRYCLYILTSNMLANLRSSVYSKLIRQPVEFFNSRENSTGQLTATLSADIRVVNGASIEMYVLIYQGLCGIVSGLTISWIFAWRIGLFATILVPINALCLCLNLIIQMRSNPRTVQHENQQRLIISDSISNYMTVGSLAQEDVLINRHFKDQKRSQYEELKEAIKFSAVYSFISSAVAWYYFCMFFVVAHNIGQGEDITDNLIAFFASVYACMPITIALLNAPDFGRGRDAADKVLHYDSQPKEGSFESSILDGTKQLTPEIAAGAIEFHHVWFRYPSSQAESWVLRDFTLRIEPGECVGLAGESGCGKSTVTQLLYRFYDPQKGYITIGGQPLNEFSLQSLRSHFGLVQQEPLIFNCSIMENIIYGKASASAEDIKAASEIANCHEFIERGDFEGEDQGIEHQEAFEDDRRYSQLPNGYKTICGPRGGRLSGGQKQRVAIARAVVRQPKVLVLDEATSALDENSQKVVQGALDNVMKECTSIVIAHRLSTLSKCDRVVKIAHGIIVN
jgi:ATP-binding cassette subfamily B (MDR/TAP) protein 1